MQHLDQPRIGTKSVCTSPCFVQFWFLVSGVQAVESSPVCLYLLCYFYIYICTIFLSSYFFEYWGCPIIIHFYFLLCPSRLRCGVILSKNGILAQDVADFPLWRKWRSTSNTVVMCSDWILLIDWGQGRRGNKGGEQRWSPFLGSILCHFSDPYSPL